jgi:hypothetical protein
VGLRRSTTSTKKAEGGQNRRRDESAIRIWREFGRIDGDVGGRKITVKIERKMGPTCKKLATCPILLICYLKK